MESKMVNRLDLDIKELNCAFISSRIDDFTSEEHFPNELDLDVLINVFNGDRNTTVTYGIRDEEDYTKVYDKIMSIREHFTTVLDEMTECFMNYKINKIGDLDEKNEELEEYKERIEESEEDWEVPIKA